jgi:NMD protein affecting ribosome stability and mRNA decay
MSKGTRRDSRRDRLIQEHDHDPYRTGRKPTEPTVCPDCGAVFRDGRWRWAAGPVDAPRQACPACQRTRDDYPAGYVHLGGPFLEEHREEILGLVHNLDERERKDHPLNRIMDVRDEEGGILVTTTDLHLARTIGDALAAAYGGEHEQRYADEERLLRVTWRR